MKSSLLQPITTSRNVRERNIQHSEYDPDIFLRIYAGLMELLNDHCLLRLTQHVGRVVVCSALLRVRKQLAD